jgi:hypothetical protein
MEITPGVYVTEVDKSSIMPMRYTTLTQKRCRNFILRCCGVNSEDIEVLQDIYRTEYDLDLLKMKWNTIKPRISYDWYNSISDSPGIMPMILSGPI